MHQQHTTGLAVGLMSGTSLDGVDAVLVRMDEAGVLTFLHGVYHPYSPEFKNKLSALAQGDIPLSDVMRLEKELTLAHVDAVQMLLREHNTSAEDVRVVGFHGQTIRHIPDEELTWQLGNPSLLAEKLGIPVVGDLRRRDMAAGGQGAPLVPLFHQALFADEKPPFMVLNIGGVANVTYVGPDGEVVAGDTGPGQGFLDAWVQRHTGELMDKDAALALAGQVDDAVVAAALKGVFYQKPLPKSADRYEFEMPACDHLSVEDGAATLVEITVKTIEHAARSLPIMPKHVWVTGGGVRNPLIMKRLADIFSQVSPVDARGLRADFMEAECFAWLAMRRLDRLPTTLPTTTGAQHPTCGGVVTV